MKNVVAYCRVSTDGQAQEDRCGIEAQKETIMKYCAENGMQISDWYIDEGESGVKENRPALDELLFGEVKNPPVTTVVVAKSDRMAREIKLYFYYMMLLEKKGIELVSATEPFVDDGTGLGNVYRSLMLFVAEQERMNINKRTSGGRKIKAARGGYSGGRPPYGYRPVDGNLVIVPEEAEVVRYVISAKKSGETFQRICDTLNEQGKTNRSGSKFSISTIQVILENEPLYRGMYRYGKGAEWVQGQHDPILTDNDEPERRKDMTFYQYMQTNHNGEDTPAGDFVEDMLRTEFPTDVSWKTPGGKKKIQEFLRRNHACEEAVETFNDCWKEYTEQTS